MVITLLKIDTRLSRGDKVLEAVDKDQDTLVFTYLEKPPSDVETVRVSFKGGQSKEVYLTKDTRAKDICYDFAAKMNLKGLSVTFFILKFTFHDKKNKKKSMLPQFNRSLCY